MIQNNILVSVLIITFNHQRYISQAIEGALMQKTNFDFEIVIGEDCSTDGTRDIVMGYKKKYPEKIKLILQEKNVSASQNFLDTFNLCSGKYIAICEGDDYWIDPYKLQKQVDFLEANPEYGMIHTGIKVIDFNNNVIKYENTQKPTGNIFFKLLKNAFIVTCSVCFKRELVVDAMESASRKNYKCIIDYWVWLHISMRSKVHYISDITSAYRSHDLGVSKQGIKFFGEILPLAVLDALSYKIDNFPEKGFTK